MVTRSPAWGDIAPTVQRSLIDFGGELAFRSACRSIPLAVRNVPVTIEGKSQSSNSIIAMLRGLMMIRVALDEPEKDHVSKIVQCHDNLKPYVLKIDGVTAIRGALSASLPLSRLEKMDEVRRAVQSANDSISNYRRTSYETPRDYHSYFESVKSDCEVLDRGVDARDLSPPLSFSFSNSGAWKNFTKVLLTFDDSWSIWIRWLSYRLMGLPSEDIPSFLWNKIERRLMDLSNEFWQQSELLINKKFAEIALEELESFVDVESNKPQNEVAITFQVSEDGLLDAVEISEENQEKEKIYKSVVNEVYERMNDLLSKCDANSNADLKESIELYLSVIESDKWTDSALVVVRGNSLRNHLNFQYSRDIDSDIAPLSQAVMNRLENCISAHNLMINSHVELLKIDRMLLSSDANVDLSPSGALYKLIRGAEVRHAMSENSIRQITVVAESRNISSSLNKENEIKASIILSNIARAALSFLWKHRSKVAGGLGALPAAAYGIGKWALANEAVLLGYFPRGSEMNAFVKFVLEWLHTLPLL